MTKKVIVNKHIILIRTNLLIIIKSASWKDDF